ncbi:hypothetical protein HG530_013613 [Fusarium avenaceum]|nr:hypothetical protein HG530_013613 [Fusarium avenaceum]
MQQKKTGKPRIGSVVNLAGKAIPAVNKDSSLRRGDGLGVVDCLPGDLREGVAQDQLTLLHGTEAVLLAVAAVPDPVPEEVGGKDGSENTTVPAVRIGVVVGQVDGAVAVRERDTSKVPEDEHETPLLVVHVPGGDDELLSLGTGVGVKEVSHDKEPNLTRYVAVLLMLTSGGAETQDEKDIPRHANLEEHLEVENAKHTGVQLSTHEEVVDWVACHAVLLAAPEGREVGDKTDEEATEDGNRQKRAKLIDGCVHRPETRVVQTSKASKSGVETPVSVAVVGQLLTAFMRKRLAVSPDTREQTVESTLNNEIRPVPGPDLETGTDPLCGKGTCHCIDLGVLTGSPTINNVGVLGNALCLLHDRLHRRSTREAVGCNMLIGDVAVGSMAVGSMAIGVSIGKAVGLAISGSVDSPHIVRVCLLVELLCESGGASTGGLRENFSC